MRTPLIAALLAAPLVFAGCDAAGPAVLDGTSAEARPDRAFTVERHDALTGEVTRGRQERLPICHRDAETGAYHRVEVGAPALPAHLRHGDGAPGGAVPGQPGYAFSDACEPVASVPFACDVEESADADGRAMLSITLRVLAPDQLPLMNSTVYRTNAEKLDAGWIEEDEVRVGFAGTFRQGTPSTAATAAIGVTGPNIEGGLFLCGPYEFGGESGG